MKRTAPSPRASTMRWLTWFLAGLTLVFCVSAMTSCATGTAATRAQPATPPPPPPPGLQANQRTSCPPLPPARSDLAPDLLENHDQVAALYHACSARTDNLQQALAEWRRTAWQWYCSAVAQLGLSTEGCAPHE
ncbi:hypothetical protein ACFONC_11730 [Luteimonas soli]|uniref:Uncharacterized protein n=1 Tax=Luteimonas soli TaxID=1648966 RepID=A0ABV7XKY9_9GAMM